MRTKKITLLKATPAHTNEYSIFAYPGLALPVLGTVLKHKGYDVKVYVESLHPWDWCRIEESDLIALTVNTAEAMDCFELAGKIRTRTKAPIVMGGYHVTYMARDALDYCDYVVRGEGEATLAELADELLEGDGNVDRIQGISYLRNGEVVDNPNRPLLQDIDLIPDQSLVEGYREYHRRSFQRFRPTGALVASSRGCPYDCHFCSIIEIFNRTTRYRSPEAVIEDIRQQTALTGRRSIYFVDDNLTAHKKKCKELLRHMIDAKLDIRFSAQVRLEFSQDEEFIELMKEAGCSVVFIGFESVNPQTLLDFGKRQTVDQIRYCIDRLRREEIFIHGMFVLGGDTDTVETCRETAEFAIREQLDSVQFLPLYPLPGTVQTAEFEQQGRLLLTPNPETGRPEVRHGAGNYVQFYPNKMSPVDLQLGILEAYERFYSWRNIGASIARRDHWLSLITKWLGHHLLKHGRRQFRGHAEWLRRHGFEQSWEELCSRAQPEPERERERLSRDGGPARSVSHSTVRITLL
jgi:radical SAM superfamily enzyme YgiQ (UPF0313 family)